MRVVLVSLSVIDAREYVDLIVKLDHVPVPDSIHSFSQIITSFKGAALTISLYNLITEEERDVQILPNDKWENSNSLLGCLVRIVQIPQIRKTIFQISKIQKNGLMDRNKAINKSNFLFWIRNSDPNPTSEKVQLYLTQNYNGLNDFVIYDFPTNSVKQITKPPLKNSFELGCVLIPVNQIRDFEEREKYFSLIQSFRNEKKYDSNRNPNICFKRNFYSNKKMIKTFKLEESSLKQATLIADLITLEEKKSIKTSPQRISENKKMEENYRNQSKLKKIEEISLDKTQEEMENKPKYQLKFSTMSTNDFFYIENFPKPKKQKKIKKDKIENEDLKFKNKNVKENTGQENKTEKNEKYPENEDGLIENKIEIKNSLIIESAEEEMNLD